MNEYEIKPNLQRVSAVKYINDCILYGKKKGYSTYKIILESNQRTYPNICAPIAGVIQYYVSNGLNFIFDYQSSHVDYLQHTSINAPLSAEEKIGTIDMDYPLDKVWKFTSSKGINELVSSYIKSIRQDDILGTGILSGLEWCLNESMDNIIQHSNSDYGYIMGQLQKTSNKLLFCVFDTGRGIYNSFKESTYNPTNGLDAITLAIREGVTRDKDIGQGNGMWGLSQIVRENSGVLRISSAGSVLKMKENVTRTVLSGDFNLGKNNGTNTIDFQLDYSVNMDIAKALNGYVPTDLWIENLEDDNDNIILNVKEQCSGTGTRQSGKKFRLMIINTIKQTHKKVILDFDTINIVSSSFADELIGKLIAEYGFIFFIQSIILKNINSTNIQIINRSVGQRMAQKYYNEKINEIE